MKLQEENEKERVKYFLILHGLRKKRKLERPVHVMKLALSFIETNLDLKVLIKYLNILKKYLTQNLSHKGCRC